MTTEYDPIAEEYAESKQLVFRMYSEVPNHLAMLGDVSGLRVLDLACGDGFYTRRIRNAGADCVLGVDVSAEMIDHALAQEAADPIGLHYRACSATDLSSLSTDSFDLASTAFLFNCARNQQELLEMFRQITGQLRSGGRLCATVGDLGHQPNVDYSKYGMRTCIKNDLPEGAPYEITFLLESREFTITDFNHSLSTYQKMGEAVGLTFQGWYPCTVTPEGIQKYGEAFWRDWIESPCIWRFSAVKN